jgi:exoribonuclease-2
MTLVVHHRDDLQRVAHRALRDRGLLDAFDSSALEQLDGIRVASEENGADIRDLRGLPWCSIDNDESRDLDQLSAALDLGDGSVRVFVAIADVDTLVDKDTPIDAHAAHNTASVYVAGHVYPMLPEKLSTDLTSLGQGVDRISLVVEFVVREEGSLAESEISRGVVRNHAKLTYNAVAAWMDGHGPLPEAAASVRAWTRSFACRMPSPGGCASCATRRALSILRRWKRGRCSRTTRSWACTPRNPTAPIV